MDKFKGDKLKFFRELYDKSLREIAEIVGLSHTAIDKYEKNMAIPNSEVLMRLAKYFNVRFEEFFQDELSLDSLILNDINFRTYENKAPNDSLYQKAITQIKENLQKNLEIRRIVNFDFNNKGKFDKITIKKEEDLEKAAYTVRRFYSLREGPIYNLLEVLEENHFIITTFDLPEFTIDGVQGTIFSVPFIAVNKNASADRNRFTISHELSHLWLDYKIEGDKEKMANKFAGYFLLPKKDLKRELGSYREKLNWYELKQLKMKYKVSIQAIIVRAYQDMIISREERNYWYDFLKKKEYIKCEPVKITPEMPQLFIKLVCKAASEKKISYSKAAELLNLSSEKEFLENYFENELN